MLLQCMFAPKIRKVITLQSRSVFGTSYIYITCCATPKVHKKLMLQFARLLSEWVGWVHVLVRWVMSGWVKSYSDRFWRSTSASRCSLAESRSVARDLGRPEAGAREFVLARSGDETWRPETSGRSRPGCSRPTWRPLRAGMSRFLLPTPTTSSLDRYTQSCPIFLSFGTDFIVVDFTTFLITKDDVNNITTTITTSSRKNMLAAITLYTPNLLENVPVKEFWKSVKIWQSHGHEFGVQFFGPPCMYMKNIGHQWLKHERTSLSET